MSANVTSVVREARPRSNSLRRFGLLSLNNLVMYSRNRAVMFWVIAFPIGYMLLFGAIYGTMTVDPNNPNSAKLITYMVPGIIVMSLMSNGIIGNANGMAVWRERGILRRLQATPLPAWQMLVSRILVQSMIMVGQAIILVAVSIALYGVKYEVLGLLQALPFVILGAILFMAIGQMIAALVGKAETVAIACQLIYFPLLFLSGLVIPLDQLPEGIQNIGKYLPTAMIGDLVRAPMLSGFEMGSFNATHLPMAVDLLGAVIYLIVTVFISARFFKWD